MGYTTDFTGKISIEPPLSFDEVAFLKKFSESRRMERDQGPYYVDAGGFMGQDRDGVVNHNMPPCGQPGLWCQWIPSDCGTSILWNECEKFYDSVEWIQYIIDHFIGDNPIAMSELLFLRPHKLSGRIEAQGEEYSDRWTLEVKDNVAKKIYRPRLGEDVECPNCGEEFKLDAKTIM